MDTGDSQAWAWGGGTLGCVGGVLNWSGDG